MNNVSSARFSVFQPHHLPSDWSVRSKSAERTAPCSRTYASIQSSAALFCAAHSCEYFQPMPAASSVEDMKFARQEQPDGPGLVRCWLQAKPVRRLPNLRGIPILIVTAEASYHAPYDHCTSQFLRQAGVEHEFVRLEDAGIRGNGHFMMLEKNNLEIARYLREWLEANAM